MNTLPAVISKPDLPALAEAIKAAHQTVLRAGESVIRATGDMLESARVAGEKLIVAKSAIDRGEWLSWLGRECSLSAREAQRYMFIARNWAALEANTTRVSDLSLRGAIKLIQDLQAAGSDERSPRRSQKSRSVKKPTSFDALGWWSAATLEARRHFIDGVGSRSVNEAIPPLWEMQLVPATDDAVGVVDTGAVDAITTAPVSWRVSARENEDRRDRFGRNLTGIEVTCEVAASLALPQDLTAEEVREAVDTVSTALRQLGSLHRRLMHHQRDAGDILNISELPKRASGVVLDLIASETCHDAPPDGGNGAGGEPVSKVYWKH